MDDIGRQIAIAAGILIGAVAALAIIVIMLGVLIITGVL